MRQKLKLPVTSSLYSLEGNLEVPSHISPEWIQRDEWRGKGFKSSKWSRTGIYPDVKFTEEEKLDAEMTDRRVSCWEVHRKQELK